jgi:hypothetical protein
MPRAKRVALALCGPIAHLTPHTVLHCAAIEYHVAKRIIDSFCVRSETGTNKGPSIYVANRSLVFTVEFLIVAAIATIPSLVL